MSEITAQPMNRWLRLTLITSAFHLAVATALFLVGFNLSTANRAGVFEAPKALTQISNIWNAPYFYLWSPVLEKNYPEPENRHFRGITEQDHYRMHLRIYPTAIILLRSTGFIVSTLLCGAALSALYSLATRKKLSRPA